MDDDELEEKVGLMLAYAWRQFYAVWGKKIKGRSVLDVFQHRVKVASYMPTFQRFLEKLAHGLGLQSLSVPGELIEELKGEGDRVMDLLREESVYLVVKAYNLSKKIKIKKGGEGNENAED